MRNILLSCGFLSLILLFSCDNSAKMKAAFIEQEIKTGIEKRMAQRHAECMTAAMDSASRIADSLVAAKMTAIDTSLLRRPERPKKPIIESPLDTTPVKPILPK